MIPLLIPPLTGLQVLVTRPASQATGLIHRLEKLGAQTLALPMLELVAHDHVLPASQYDLLIFISSNAVHFGQAVLAAQPQARLAAVGASTAQTLLDAGHQVDVTPESATSSEALLAHPLLQKPPAKVLIVRGVGGRELLRDTLIKRGSQVEVLEVYRRVPAQPDAQQLQALNTHILDGMLDVITLTSVEIAQALHHLLEPAIRDRAQHIAVLAGSSRIAQAARELGWLGERIIATSPEDEALVTALARWHTRAR
jgi:uroporphyrinogen-III synthase